MEHQMKLHFGPFETIKSRVKDVEMRLNDEKRKLVEVGILYDLPTLQLGKV